MNGVCARDSMHEKGCIRFEDLLYALRNVPCDQILSMYAVYGEGGVCGADC